MERAHAARKGLAGMVHLGPLPGSPGASGHGIERVLAAAQRDATVLLEAGFDGWIVENFGDAPFYPGPVPASTVAAMTRIAAAMPRGADSLCGVNVLRNDALSALAVAAACGLDFVRVNVHVGAAVTDQGVIEGRAYETMRERARWAPEVAVLADVDVKHARPLGIGAHIAESAAEAAGRGLADGLIVTGKSTGARVDLNDLRAVRDAALDVPVLLGSGVSADSVAELLAKADGVIVGTALKVDGVTTAAVDPERARAFIAAARKPIH
ncbi:MAG: BtpA/SgcQ family protein [Myxococcota bacterium]